MPIGEALGDVIDKITMGEDFDQARVDASKVAAPETGLVLANRSQSNGLTVATPNVRRLMNDRISRRASEEQTRKLQEMMYMAQRSQFASQTIGVVVAHAAQALDQTQEALASRYTASRARRRCRLP